MEKITISVKDMFDNVIKRWRMLIVFMVIFAVLFDGYAIYKNLKSSGTSSESDKQIKTSVQSFLGSDADEDEVKEFVKIEKLLNKAENATSGLSDREINEVQTLAESYEDIYRTLDSVQGYAGESILMQLDASAVPTSTLVYRVDTHHESVYPVIESTNYEWDIASTIGNSLRGNDFYQKLIDAAELDCSIEYVDELINYTINGTNVITINAYGPDEASCEKMAQVIADEVERITAEDCADFGEFDVICISDTTYTAANSNVESDQVNQASYVNTLRNTASNLSTGLATDQKSYYALYLDYLEEKNKLDSESLEKFDEYQLEKENIEGDDSESSSSSLGISEIINVKYILVGIIAGLVIAALLIIIKYLVSKKLRQRDDLELGFGVTVLGTISSEKKHTAALDRWVYGRIEGGISKFSRDERLEIICAGIKVAAEKQNAGNVFITGTGNDEDSDKLRKELAEQLSGLNAESGKSVIYDPESLQKLSKADSVVVIERTGISTYKEIKKEIELCNRSGALVLGAAVIE